MRGRKVSFLEKYLQQRFYELFCYVLFVGDQLELNSVYRHCKVHSCKVLRKGAKSPSTSGWLQQTQPDFVLFSKKKVFGTNFNYSMSCSWWLALLNRRMLVRHAMAFVDILRMEDIC